VKHCDTTAVLDSSISDVVIVLVIAIVTRNWLAKRNKERVFIESFID